MRAPGRQPISSRQFGPSPLMRALLVVLAPLAACTTIPIDQTSRTVDDDPEELFAPASTAPVETVPEDESVFELTLYFYNPENQLVTVMRNQESQPTLQDLLDALAVPPSDSEQVESPGLSTRLFGEMAPTAGPSLEGQLPIQVSGDSLRIATDDRQERVQRIYSQVVCSVVANSTSIVAVQINDDEGPVSVVSLVDGAPVEGYVTKADMNDCMTVDDIVEDLTSETESAEEGGGETGSTTTTANG